MNKNTPVHEVMHYNVIVARISNTFSQVRLLFLQANLHHLPVVDNEDNLVGIISSHDVLKAYAYKAPTFDNVDDATMDAKVSLDSIMTKEPVTVSNDDTIGSVAEILANRGLQALPVIKNGKVVGIITARDITKHFAIHG